jgi:hypothetical protein
MASSSLIVGVPARKVWDLAQEKIKELIEHICKYEKLGLIYGTNS